LVWPLEQNVVCIDLGQRRRVGVGRFHVHVEDEYESGEADAAVGVVEDGEGNPDKERSRVR
jgi:hypothetical protein